MESTKLGFKLTVILLLSSMLLFWTITKYSYHNAHQMKPFKWWGHRGDHSTTTAGNYTVQPDVCQGCHGHVQLWWLRDVLSQRYNQTFPMDIYDLSTLYKFKTHMFLVTPNLFQWTHIGGPVLYEKGKVILQAMKLERMLTGTKLEPIGFPNLRKCDYNPDKDYKYRFNAYYHQDNVHVYVDEILLAANETGRINDIFGVITTNITVSACELIDYFSNHTYHIVCPVVEKKFQIGIDANYHDVSPSLFQCREKNVKRLKLYTNKDLNHTRDGWNPQMSLKKSAVVKCINSKGHQNGFWLKGVAGLPPSVFHWATASCHYSFIISDTSLKCLRRKKVLMIGDSHMRMRHQSMLSTYNLTNFEFYQSTHSIHLLHNLFLTFEAFLNGSKYANVLLVNAGAHDFLFLDIITYIATMSDIFTMFKRFSDLPKPPTIIWLEIYPTPYNGDHRSYMTNLVAKGTNDWVNHNMKELGIEVVHSFDIGITMESHDKDRIHFWDSFGPNMIPPGGKTSVGGAVISVLFNMICPNVTVQT